VDRNPQQYLQ